MNPEVDRTSGIGLREAIESIRADLVAAQTAGADTEIQFPVQSLTIELQVVATRGADGRAGFKIPFLDLELGGSGSRASERTSTITVEFGAPVSPSGRSVQVADRVSERLG